MRIENGISRGLEKGFFDGYSKFIYYYHSFEASNTYSTTIGAEMIIEYINRNK